MVNNENCPCGSGLLYSECCEPAIKGTKPPETAEKLMRSRYSAYVKSEIPYLVETTHPEQRHLFNEKDIRQWSESSQWQKLQVISTKAGTANHLSGQVEFIADYLEKGVKKSHHELSSFKKENGKWYYESGIDPSGIKPVINKIGRNDPCHCGSGKKFKKCCGKN